MGVFDNSPTSHYIRLTGIIVTYNDKIYNVEDFYTDKKYIYWEADNPYVLKADNLLLNTSLRRFLIMLNDKGMSQPVESQIEGFTVSYDGNSIENIRKDIIGIHDSDKVMGDRVTAIEIDVEGIHTTVGKWDEKDGSITESITQIKQNADSIRLSLEKTQKEFADNTELVLLRERLNKSFIDLTASLGIAKGDFTDFFHDTIIEQEVEKPKILTHLEVLKNKEAKLYLELDTVIALVSAQGQTESLNAIKQGKTLVENSMKNLYEMTETIISDGTIVPSEDVTVVTLFGKCEFAITSLKRTLDDIVFLGSGGMLTEYIADIYYTVNGVKETFTETITNMKNQTSILKAEFQQQVNDVTNALNTYKDYVSNALKDGIIDEAEKKIMKQRLDELEKEKKDITYQYDKYKADPMISDVSRASLTKDYEDYINKHETLIQTVEDVISDNMTDDAEKLRVDTAFTNYATSLNNFKTTMDKTIDELNKNKYNQAIEEAKKNTEKELNDVRNELDNLNNEMNTTFKDNVIDETERRNIELDMQNIEKEKVDIDNQFQLYYNNKTLDGQKKTDFKNAYDTYITDYNALQKLVQGILAKQELVTEKDKEDIKNAKEKLFASLNSFLDNAKKVVEYINTKENDALKNEMNNEFGDVNNALGALKDEMNTSFKDGVLDEVEIKSLNDRLLQIEKEKKEVDEVYNEIYNNPHLI